MVKPDQRIALAEVDLGGERLVIISYPLDERASLALTKAEADVARRAAAGESDAHIAASRGTSRRTVANQLASIFRKVGVSSRVALAGALANRSSR